MSRKRKLREQDAEHADCVETIFHTVPKKKNDNHQIDNRQVATMVATPASRIRLSKGDILNLASADAKTMNIENKTVAVEMYSDNDRQAMESTLFKSNTRILRALVYVYVYDDKNLKTKRTRKNMISRFITLRADCKKHVSAKLIDGMKTTREPTKRIINKRSQSKNIDYVPPPINSVVKVYKKSNISDITYKNIIQNGKLVNDTNNRSYRIVVLGYLLRASIRSRIVRLG